MNTLFIIFMMAAIGGSGIGLLVNLTDTFDLHGKERLAWLAIGAVGLLGMILMRWMSVA